MKRLLFWKILIGFWITFIIITQGIWLMFTILRPLPPDAGRARANMAVAAAASAIRLGGPGAFTQQLKMWPRDERGRISVQRLSGATGRTPAQPGLAEATAPDGTVYRISYPAQLEPHGPFDIPREVVIVALVGGLAFAAILAWYLTSPIRRLRIGFAKLAQGDFATRLGPSVGRRRDEIADLAHHFDQMAVRLEELVASRDRLLADVSHELRSPLARLTLAIGLARQDPSKMEASLERIAQEAARLDEMVGELLTLSKLESGVKSSDEYLDFSEIVKRVIADAKYEAAVRNVDVSLDIETPAAHQDWIVAGNGKLLSRGVENIVRNAVRFSPAGEAVRATLSCPGSGHFLLSVADRGPGAPEAALPTLFKPFVQGGSSDGEGFGLGLAITQRAITVHGGAIFARNRPGGGLIVSASLPAGLVEPQ